MVKPEGDSNAFFTIYFLGVMKIWVGGGGVEKHQIRGPPTNRALVSSNYALNETSRNKLTSAIHVITSKKRASYARTLMPTAEQENGGVGGWSGWVEWVGILLRRP